VDGLSTYISVAHWSAQGILRLLADNLLCAPCHDLLTEQKIKSQALVLHCRLCPRLRSYSPESLALDIAATADVAKLATVNLGGVISLELVKDIAKVVIVSLQPPPEPEATNSPLFGDRIFRRSWTRFKNEERPESTLT